MTTGRITPGAVWTGSSFESRTGVELDELGRWDGALAEPSAPSHPDRALLPGFVNAHSHAFQIGLRGHGERYPTGRGSFWTWREAMYDLVSSMTRDRLYELSRRAFDEMLAAGITTVGEFHYLRHLEGDLDFAGDEIVLAAARDSGIQIVLLAVYYATGGIGEPLGPAQRRFATPDPPTFWRQVDRLGGLLSAGQHLGIAPHSIRAVPRPDLVELHAEAQRRRLPVHMHLEEQRREIEECRTAYGLRPMEILLEDLGDLDGFTAVHCTHTPPELLERFFAAGGRACICPLTEGNLGDGLPSLAEVSDLGGRLCLGTDSNLRISMLEEMRWLEYGQRVRREERGSIAGEDGARLLEAATVNGSRALVAAGSGPLPTTPVLVPRRSVAESTWIYSLGEGSMTLPDRDGH